MLPGDALDAAAAALGTRAAALRKSTGERLDGAVGRLANGDVLVRQVTFLK